MRQPLGGFEEEPDEFPLMGEAREDGYGRPERRLPRFLLSLIAMAVFAGGLWFAYHLGARHTSAPAGPDGVPLIRADKQPDKVKPDDPGGMKVPDQNVSLYSDKQPAPGMEKLLPPPEQPLPRPAPAPVPAPAPAPVENQAAAPAATEPAAPATETPAAPAAAPAARPAPPARTAIAEPAAAPRVAAAKPGGIQVRLGSLRTPDEARSEWARLKHANADLLGNLTAVAVRADLGDKGVYYRIEAGPFADAAAAERLCGELKQRKLGCILAR